MAPEQKFILVLALIAEVFWVIQLIDLMSRKDNEFPGQFDKLAWAFILVVTNFIGAIAFLISKPNKSVKPSLGDISIKTAGIIKAKAGNYFPVTISTDYVKHAKSSNDLPSSSIYSRSGSYRCKLGKK